MFLRTDNKVKIKENEKGDSYLDLAGELKKLCNINVMVMPVVIGALGTVPKSFVRELEELEMGERAETIQTTVF